MRDVLISKLIVERYFEKLRNSLELDVAIVGAGPSGLTAAYELAKNGFKVAVFEERNTPGGGIWGGGMMFNEIVLERELENFLKEVEIEYEVKEDHVVVDSVHFASGLLYRATKAGAIVFNNVSVEDVAVQNGKVCGVVVNWGPTVRLGLHVDPITIKASFVVDGTGHPANVVSLLAKRGLVEMKTEFPMDADEAEKFVVDNTGEIFPGLLVSGMAVCAVYGGPRMGPIFGGMILSGQKVAKIVSERLR
ncbi:MULTISPECIES: sulfide-dependent adenosine diphosphate thiazole synthase [unclassified Thermotoga]|uniref:sulfide-dependent adenosine diphosphate thiazole synthase n=1 Tax=unclassified Thermotoga TaxID=2631113 RepID=UPI000543AA13|nr:MULTISPECIES: sulfide-dependent adenosine diphosphate thiazole synthase [unclassified Thermotoga]KAF2959737.1 ribulose-1,5-biphosphate synthetase [Thermotoga sp. 38H-to]KHC90766.1 ribulose-1,5-biphosphate synthetase [Thermotoga sp. Mc24]